MEVYQAGETIPWQFNTRDGDGAPITFAGSPAIAVRKDAATATTTDGVSLTVDSGSVTGIHTLSIDTSQNGTFYATGHEFTVIVTAGTVDGTSVVGEVILRFRLGEVSADVQAWNGGAVPNPAEAGATMTLTEAYDAAKTAAPSAATVAGAVLDEAIGEHAGFLTTLLTAAGYTAPDNASITSILEDTAALDARLTAIRAGYLDLLNTYLDAAISSRAAASTALSSAVWTAQKAGYLDTAISGVGAVAVPTVEEIDAELTSNHGSGTWGAAAVGEYSWTPDTPFVDTDSNPIEGGLVAAYSDSDRTTLVASGLTDATGSLTLYFVNSGTYYMRFTKSGYATTDFTGEAT